MHDATVLGDGAVLLVLRLGGDGQCSDPIGVYKPFYRLRSTTGGATWSKPMPIEGSGCAWPQVVTLESGITVMSAENMYRKYVQKICTENIYECWQRCTLPRL